MEGRGRGGGWWCVCDHPRQRGSGPTCFTLGRGGGEATATRRLRASIQ